MLRCMPPFPDPTGFSFLFARDFISSNKRGAARLMTLQRPIHHGTASADQNQCSCRRRPVTLGSSDTLHPLVSVIVPTRNSAQFLERCLSSIVNQTYHAIELIVVDNFSTDSTVDIAIKFTDNVIKAGPERSAQTNAGVRMSSGKFVFRVDSDFVLDPKVVEEAVDIASKGFDAIVVHNSPDASISRLARLRKFEVDMYKYDLTHSAARFIRKSTYVVIGGYNPSVTAGEDYDFQNRLTRAGVRTGFIAAEALHLGEPTDLLHVLRKYYTYGEDFVRFVPLNDDRALSQLGPIRLAFVRNWRAFIRHPLLGTDLVFYHLMRFIAGAAGYLVSKFSQSQRRLL